MAIIKKPARKLLLLLTSLIGVLTLMSMKLIGVNNTLSSISEKSEKVFGEKNLINTAKADVPSGGGSGGDSGDAMGGGGDSDSGSGDAFIPGDGCGDTCGDSGAEGSGAEGAEGSGDGGGCDGDGGGEGCDGDGCF